MRAFSSSAVLGQKQYGSLSASHTPLQPVAYPVYVLPARQANGNALLLSTFPGQFPSEVTCCRSSGLLHGMGADVKHEGANEDFMDSTSCNVFGHKQYASSVVQVAAPQ